jgi:hypothetical protein
LTLRSARRFAPLLLVLVVGCSSLGSAPQGGGGNRIVTPAPAPRVTPTAGAAATEQMSAPASAQARLRGEGLSSTDLYSAYRALLDTYVTD